MRGHFQKNSHHLAKKNDEFLTKKDGQKNVNVPFRTFVTSPPMDPENLLTSGFHAGLPAILACSNASRLEASKESKGKRTTYFISTVCIHILIKNIYIYT